MYKIAVVGERSSVVGFAALGLEVFPAESGEEAASILHRLAKSEEYAIIYVTETYFEAISPVMDKYKDSVTPAIILIPGAGGSTGIGRSALDSAVERAVGSNIL